MSGHETRSSTDKAVVFCHISITGAARRPDILSVGFPLRCPGPVHHQISISAAHRFSGPRVFPDGFFGHRFIGHVAGTQPWIVPVKIGGESTEQLIAILARRWATTLATTLASRAPHPCRGNQTSQRGTPLQKSSSARLF